MKISILTLFPQMFQGPFDYSIVKNARDKGIAQINFVDIRNFGIGKHKTVDDKPYGGGHGMILKVEVLEKAIESVIDKKIKREDQRVVLLSASAKTYTQKKAKEYSEMKHLIIVCGHYEGVDARIENYIDEEISVGDFVLTGGEIPAMIVTDSVVRLLSGVLKEGVTDLESFSGQSAYLEHPHYTRPRIHGKKSVPDVLLSGNHGKIEEWKKSESIKKTKKLRRDLIKN